MSPKKDAETSNGDTPAQAAQFHTLLASSAASMVKTARKLPTDLVFHTTTDATVRDAVAALRADVVSMLNEVVTFVAGGGDQPRRHLKKVAPFTDVDDVAEHLETSFVEIMDHLLERAVCQ